VFFDYLAKLRKFRESIFLGIGGGNEKKGYSKMKNLIKGYGREGWEPLV
jgi:hypothetical protein